MTPARTISFDAPTISPFTPPKTLRESTSISAVMAAVALACLPVLPVHGHPTP